MKRKLSKLCRLISDAAFMFIGIGLINLIFPVEIPNELHEFAAYAAIAYVFLILGE